MTVAPYQSDLFKRCKEIYGFLSDCQRQATRDQHAKLANFTVPISVIEPWLALQQLEEKYPIHFYYSTPQYTLLGLGITIIQQTAGPDRFERMQQFVDVWKRRILSPNQNGPIVQPYFLCGFTFFEQTKGLFKPAQVFVPQLQILQRNGQTTASLNYLIDDAVNITRIVDDIRQRLQALETAAEKTINISLTSFSRALQTPKVIRDVGNFQQMVSNVLPTLKSSTLHKIVLADALDVLSANPFNIPKSLKALGIAYSDCCIFSFSNGKGPVFIGASPERLLSITTSDTGKQLTTDALAGSADRGNNLKTDQIIAENLISNPKERYEHQVVVEFIAEQLTQLGLTPMFDTSPAILRLANIQHLHTPIQAYLPNHLKPLDLVKRLHPTPAVAGLPRLTANQLLKKTESFDRGPYASPIGWIDTNGNSEFVVGIRSALINGRQARLFAGAGIVAQSNPRSELAEIKLKLQALLGALV
ncbi:isochorismate synthase [Leptolyngbya sp. Heron Island J]|uniref:isochorismate synthase n=1 Tax=Leptolyngbya sp. Heron Island J TaxID=1385935 RepID=UPI0003B9D2DB|nr:isochorismate synthase [Leptolyngbya sp. Heron Island J]ESA32120.1 isochorismate synthase [Leptolyngbya sp. Heron Island J]